MSMLKVSQALARVIGQPSASRPQGLKMVWDYVKANKLKSPTNPHEILPDENLQAVFNKNVVGFSEVLGLLSQHFEKKPPVVKVPKIKAPPKDKPIKVPKVKAEPKVKVAAKPKKEASSKKTVAK